MAAHWRYAIYPSHKHFTFRQLSNALECATALGFLPGNLECSLLQPSETLLASATVEFAHPLLEQPAFGAFALGVIGKPIVRVHQTALDVECFDRFFLTIDDWLVEEHPSEELLAKLLKQLFVALVRESNAIFGNLSRERAGVVDPDGAIESRIVTGQYPGALGWINYFRTDLASRLELEFLTKVGCAVENFEHGILASFATVPWHFSPEDLQNANAYWARLIAQE